MENHIWKEDVWRQRVQLEETASLEGTKYQYSDESWKAYIRYLDTELRETYPTQFLGTVSRTEEDRENGFLSVTGESVWIELYEDESHLGRHICDAKQGIWILRDGHARIYLYLSYTLGTYWVISLPGNTNELISCIQPILHARDTKYVYFSDTDSVRIWRDVYSWEDIMRLP